MFAGLPVDGTEILLLKASPPFRLDDVVAFVSEVAAGGHPGVVLDMPSILDMRDVTLAEITAADVSRYVMRRAALTATPEAGPMAAVCSDMTSFGMLRMFGIVSDLSGLRPEEQFCVTTDIDEATDFLAAQIGLDGVSDDSLRAQVRNTVDAMRRVG